MWRCYIPNLKVNTMHADAFATKLPHHFTDHMYFCLKLPGLIFSARPIQVKPNKGHYISGMNVSFVIFEKIPHIKTFI